MNRRRAAGFTLLEILLALVLLAFVMLGVWGAVRGATRVAHGADALMAQSEAVRTVQQFLRRYVGAAQPQPFATGPDTPPEVFAGDATHMQFVAPLPVQSGHAGLYLQELILRRKAGDTALWLSYQPYGTHGAARDGKQQHLLLKHLASGHFQYLSAGGFGQPAKWHAAWQGTHGLPAAVRIDLDPAWRARVAFPQLVIRVHAGSGGGATTPMGAGL